jgi:hypothetical protein
LNSVLKSRFTVRKLNINSGGNYGSFRYDYYWCRTGWQSPFTNPFPNVELIFGTASFTGHKTLRVETKEGETRELTANKVIIDAGRRPKIPDIE